MSPRKAYWWQDEPEPDDVDTERDQLKQESFQRATRRLELAYGEYAERNKEKLRRQFHLPPR